MFTMLSNVSTLDVLFAVLTVLGGFGIAMIEMRRSRDDASHRERTAALEVRVMNLQAWIDALDDEPDEEPDDEEPEPAPKPARKRRAAT